MCVCIYIWLFANFLQLQSLQMSYDQFRRDNTGVGYFVVQVGGDSVTLRGLKEGVGGVQEGKVCVCEGEREGGRDLRVWRTSQ